MAGTREGGRKAAAKNLASDPDFYKNIGHKGGKRQVPKGFALDRERASTAGRKGGLKKRKAEATADQPAPAPAKKRWPELVFGKAYKRQYQREK